MNGDSDRAPGQTATRFTLSIAIVCIGTELTRGEIENTNASWLCRELVAVGASVAAIETIPDDPGEIRATLERLGRTHELVICTGGLGPTTDDITSLVVAETLGVRLQRDAASEQRLRERYARRGMSLGESNAKQADFPEGATVCPNDWGTAPGFSVRIGGALSYFFPGVPREMQPMFTRYVLPAVRQARPQHTAQVRLRTYGAPESRVNDLLAGIEAEFGVTVGYRAHFPEIDVKPMATRTLQADAEAAVHAAAAAIGERLGALVYGRGDAGLPETVVALARERGLTLGLAESCSGGLVASLLTAQSCSDVFLGAVVSYANSVKQQLLGVPSEVLDTEGAVSQRCAEQMARGARRVLGCDLALAITGIAGPGGATPDKPLGLVHFAVCSGDTVDTRQVVFQGERDRVQRGAAYFGLDLLRRRLNGSSWE